MRNLYWGVFALSALVFSACSSTQEARTPSSQGLLNALGPKAALNCDRGEIKLTTIYASLVRETNGDFTLKYRRLDGKPWMSSAACKEQDNGLTCFAKENTVFRVDYRFKTPTRYRGEAAYDRVKFNDIDNFRCELTNQEDPVIYKDSQWGV